MYLSCALLYLFSIPQQKKNASFAHKHAELFTYESFLTPLCIT